VVTVLRREVPLPHPQGRLATAPAGTVVLDDVAGDRTEEVRLASGPGGTLTFARLAWPGYTAHLDGADVPVRQGPAGLLTVDVPPGASGLLELGWRPPALVPSLLSALLGAAIALGHAVARVVRRRRSDRPMPPSPALEPTPAVAEPAASR
jgi:hypothetical protein